jgi:nitrous oxidase accessory protein
VTSVRATLLLTVLAAASCANGEAASVDRTTPAAPRPDRCTVVEAGADLAAAIAATEEGGALCLAPGEHAGPVRVDRRVELWGPRSAVVRGTTPGSIVVVTAPGARVAGFTIDGTGGRFDVLDAAVHVIADDVTVEGVAVVHAVYGILVERTRRVIVRGNHVRGDAATAMGLRGDTIRLWETHDSLVADNLVEDGRDMVVWYSRGNRIVGNRVERGRYGTHFMFSHDNVVEDNRFVSGVVGVFVMYSRGVTLRRNLVLDAGGVAGMAIGLKDSGNIVLEDNLLVRNATGIFIDQSPGRTGDRVDIRGNVIRQCEAGISFHTTPQTTEITGNDFADNLETVRASQGVEPSHAFWHRNYFDEYAGYDLDGNGTGDLPHEARSASEELITRHPDLAFFRGAPVLGVVDAASKLLPLWTPRTLLVDEAPRMAARDPMEVLDAR